MRLVRFLIALVPVLLAAQSPFDFRQVDELLQESIGALTPGLGVTLVVDGEVAYRKAFGSFETDRRVPIASATKWYSAATILTLVDAGLLRLDEPVAVRLPQFRDPSKSSITLRQLLSHTSGLVADLSCLHDGSTMATCVGEIASEPLRFPPGSRFVYGNASMQVAGRLAEVAAGKPWTQIFQERLAAPLGMSCTTLDAFGPNPEVAFSAVSCEADYAKFLQMLLGHGTYRGNAVLLPATVEEMMRDQTRGAPIVESIYSDYGNLDAGLPALRYGLGTWRERVGLNGVAQELGSQGATGFSPWIDRERNVAGVLATDSSQTAIMSTYLALKDAVRRAVQPWVSRPLQVTSTGSYRTGPVAPGLLISIFGNGIGAIEASAGRVIGGLYPRFVAGTRVLFDGQPSPLLYTSWGQINAAVPFAVEGRDRVTVQVERDGVLGPTAAVAVVPAVPAIFQDGAGRGLVLNQDGTLNSPQNPAEQGSVIVFYATGGGQTVQPASDGELQGVSLLRNAAAASAGGAPAEILYAGSAPGIIAGVHQINARLSNATSTGSGVALVLTVAGTQSPPVQIAVKPKPDNQ